MNQATYKGDLALKSDIDGDFSITLRNGQPQMTEFFDTLVNLLVFGEDSSYNSTVKTENEKMKSRFPELLRTANVSDETIAEGIVHLTEATRPLINRKIAKSVFVDGEIISVYGIAWLIEIERLTGDNLKFSILWEKGFAQLENIN